MSSYKIIIVEDEQIPAMYMKKSLEQYGHKVLSIISNSDDLFNYLNDDNIPDIILMDIKINGNLDGIKTAEEIRKLYNIAILYISAYSDNSFLNRAKETYPIGYLVKPIQPLTLLSTIEIGMDNFLINSKTDKVTLTRLSYFNFNEHFIMNNGVQIELSIHESLLLNILIKNKNNLLTYSVLENLIWKNEIPGVSALRTLLWRLRKKLPNGVEIKNLYSSGYKILY